MATDEYALIPTERYKRMWRATQAVERGAGGVPTGENQPLDEGIIFRNDSGEEIPPYAIMQVIGTAEDAGRNYLLVDKPLLWTGALTGPFLFNNQWAVATGEFGTAQDGPIFRCIKDSTSLSIGVRIGPVNNQWTVGKGCLYSFIGNDDVATDCIRVIGDSTPLLGAAPVGGIASGASGTVTVRVPSATTWSAGSVTYTAWNDAPTAISGSARVMIMPINAKWVAVELC